MRLFGVVALAVAVWPASSRADWFCSAKEPWHQPVERLFSAHDDTYIITGIPSSRTDPKQVKFQFSFKFDLTPNEGPCGLFFAYTQRSLWNAYALSSPFEDTSYNPQLFLTFGLKDLNSLGSLPTPGRFAFLWARLGVEHESNGRDGVDSRSLNQIFVSARFAIGYGSPNGPYLTLEPKLWIPFPGPGNPDIVEYIGYGQLNTEVGWHSVFGDGYWQDVNLGLLLRKGTVGSHGTVQLTLRYRPPWRVTSITFYTQAFFGYDETLLHYNQRTTTWRFGIAFDDRFNWTTGAPGHVQRPPPPP
jgi:outer membrane phospholipase A